MRFFFMCRLSVGTIAMTDNMGHVGSLSAQLALHSTAQKNTSHPSFGESRDTEGCSFYYSAVQERSSSGPTDPKCDTQIYTVVHFNRAVQLYDAFIDTSDITVLEEIIYFQTRAA